MNVGAIKASYRRAFEEHGENIFVRRYTGSGTARPAFQAAAKAVVTGFAPAELIGTIVQGDRKLIVQADDLIAAQFALPVTTNDKVLVRGKELAIVSVDDSTRRVGAALIAYELQVRG